MKKLYTLVMKDQLYQNSLFIIIGTLILAMLGFVFWVIIARTLSVEAVGIATSLIAAVALIAGISELGLSISLIRYLPKSQDRSVLINSSMLVAVASTLIVSIIFLVGVKFFSPKLEFLNTHPIYFVTFTLFAVFLTWNNLVESIFKAYRASKNILIKNIILSLGKLLLAIGFLSFGAYGIFSSVLAATAVACIAGLLILHFRYGYQPKLRVDIPLVRKLSKFSAANYLAGFFYQAPILLLPIVVINFLAAKSAAYFYIDSTILNLLIIIPVAVTQTLLAEGSYDEMNLGKHIRKASLAIIILLVPAVLVTVFFGEIVLRFFGDDYVVQAFQLLQLMCISTIFMAFSLMGCAVLRVKHKIIQLVMTNFVGAVMVLSGCFVMLPNGLFGLGVGWLAGQFLMSLLFLPVIIGEMDST